MTTSLPDHATPASHARFALAQRIAAACPPHIGMVIAVTGSTARGHASGTSDLELNLWVETLPAETARVGWLQSLGARDIQFEPAPRDDDSHWIAAQIDSISCEIGWQTFAALDLMTARLLSGFDASPRGLALGELIASAVILSDDERLSTLQNRLRAYPDSLQHRVIGAALDDLLAEPLTETQRTALVRVIFAAHRRWQPGSAKALLASVDAFPDVGWRVRLEALLKG